MDNRPLATVTILGIDPSSDITGVALLRADELLRFTALGHAAVFSTAKHDDSLTERIARIHEIASDIRTWVQRLPASWLPNEIAYEKTFHRGDDATEAIFMATGAYLVIPEFSSVLRVRDIHVQTAIGVKGLTQLQRAKVEGSRAQLQKRKQIKLGSVAWARQYLNLTLEDHEDAISDAYAVAVAAARQWREELLAAQSNPVVHPLFGQGSRGGKTARTTKQAKVCPPASPAGGRTR